MLYNRLFNFFGHYEEITIMRKLDRNINLNDTSKSYNFVKIGISNKTTINNK